MNSTRINTRKALDQLLRRNPIPSTEQMNSRLDNMWERLRFETENTPTEHVSISVSIRPHWGFGKTPWVVTSIVLAAMLVSVFVWRLEIPSSTAFRGANSSDHTLSRSSSQRGAEPLQLSVPGDAFELASVKLVPQSSQAFQFASIGESSQSMWIGCPGGFNFGRHLDPGRLTIDAASLLSLVIFAYDRDCTLVEGGPAWARSGEYYEIRALLPQGTPGETLEAFSKGQASRLQGMLQTLLADRFRLVLRREMKEVPVYALTVANPEKLKLSPEEILPLPPDLIPGAMAQLKPSLRRGALLSAPGTHLMGHAVSASDLARTLRQFAGRIVVDKTGRSDLFDVDLKFAPASPAVPTPSIPPLPPPGAAPPAAADLQQASLQDALEKQLGLKLEATKMPLEVLVIESVERPSPN